MADPKRGSRQVTRRNAREAALQSLFVYDQNPDTTPEQTRRFVADELDFPKLEQFCMGLIDGVREHLAEIDALLGEAALNWKLSRMAAVDRAVLRLATYELKYAQDAPPKVVINEALELCKQYSGGESSNFVNGVLDRVHRRLQEPTPDAPPAESTSVEVVESESTSEAITPVEPSPPEIPSAEEVMPD